MNRRAPYFFLFPSLLILTIFSFIPMLQIVRYSFLRYSFFSGHTFAGLAQYSRLIADPNFWNTLTNSVIYIAVTPALIILSLLLALLVRRLKRGSKLVRFIFFLPVVTPIVVTGIIWRWMFTEETGIVNYFLSLGGIEKISWLSAYPTNIFSVMLVTLWRGAGYYMMIFLAGLAAIPKEVEEAADIDGASPFRRITDILLPMLRPTILFIFVVSGSSAIKIFTEIYIMIPGTPMSNKSLVALMYQQAFERFDISYGSALGVVLFLVTMVFSYFNVRMMENRT